MASSGPSNLAGLSFTASSSKNDRAGALGNTTLRETLQCLAQQRHALALRAAAAEQQANGVAGFSEQLQHAYAVQAVADLAAAHRCQPVPSTGTQQPMTMQWQLQPNSHNLGQAQQQLLQWQLCQGRHQLAMQTAAAVSPGNSVDTFLGRGYKMQRCETGVTQWSGTKRKLPSPVAASKRHQADSSCGLLNAQLGADHPCSTLLAAIKQSSRAHATHTNLPSSQQQVTSIQQQLQRLRNAAVDHVTADAACVHRDIVCLKWGQHGKRCPKSRRSRLQASSAHSGATDQVVPDNGTGTSRDAADSSDVSSVDAPSSVSTRSSDSLLPSKGRLEDMHQQLDKQQLGPAYATGTVPAEAEATVLEPGVTLYNGTFGARLTAIGSTGTPADGATQAQCTAVWHQMTTVAAAPAEAAAPVPPAGRGYGEKQQGTADSSADQDQGHDHQQQQQPPIGTGDGSSDTSVRDQGLTNVEVVDTQQLTGQKTGAGIISDHQDQMQQQSQACQHDQPTQQQHVAQLQPTAVSEGTPLLLHLVTCPYLFQPCISCAPVHGCDTAVVTLIHTTDYKQSFCQHCSEWVDHKDLLKVLRLKRYPVLSVAGIGPLADVSGVQQYAYGPGSKAVYLHPRPATKQMSCSSKSWCVIDGRKLQDSSSCYCSIQCKLQAEGVLSVEALLAGNPGVAAAQAHNQLSEQGTMLDAADAAATCTHVQQSHLGTEDSQAGCQPHSQAEPVTRVVELALEQSMVDDNAQHDDSSLKAWGCRRQRTDASRQKHSCSVSGQQTVDARTQDYDASGSNAAAATAAEAVENHDKGLDGGSGTVDDEVGHSSLSLESNPRIVLPTLEASAMHVQGQQQSEVTSLAAAAPATCALQNQEVATANTSCSNNSNSSQTVQADISLCKAAPQQQQQHSTELTMLDPCQQLEQVTAQQRCTQEQQLTSGDEGSNHQGQPGQQQEEDYLSQQHAEDAEQRLSLSASAEIVGMAVPDQQGLSTESDVQQELCAPVTMPGTDCGGTHDGDTTSTPLQQQQQQQHTLEVVSLPPCSPSRQEAAQSVAVQQQQPPTAASKSQAPLEQGIEGCYDAQLQEQVADARVAAVHGQVEQQGQQQQQQLTIEEACTKALQSAVDAAELMNVGTFRAAGCTPTSIQQPTIQGSEPLAVGSSQSSGTSAAGVAETAPVAAVSGTEHAVAAGITDEQEPAAQPAADQDPAADCVTAAAQVATASGKALAVAASPVQQTVNPQPPAAVASLGDDSCSKPAGERVSAAAKASPAPPIGIPCTRVGNKTRGSRFTSNPVPAGFGAPTAPGKPNLAPVIGIPVPGQHFKTWQPWTGAATAAAAAAAARQFSWNHAAAASAAQQQQYRWPVTAAPAAHNTGWTHPMAVAAQQYSMPPSVLTPQRAMPGSGRSAAAPGAGGAAERAVIAAAAGSAQQRASATQQLQQGHSAPASSCSLQQKTSSAETSAAARAAATTAAVASQKVAWCWKWNAVTGEFEPLYDAPLSEKQQQRWPHLVDMQQHRPGANYPRQQQQQLSPGVWASEPSELRSQFKEASTNRRLQQLQSHQRQEYDPPLLRPPSGQRWSEHQQRLTVLDLRAEDEIVPSQQQLVQQSGSAAAVADSSIDEASGSLGGLVLGTSSGYRVPAAQSAQERLENVAYSLYVNPNQTLPKKHAQPGDYKRRESCKSWDAEEYELAAVAGAAQLGIPLAPLNQTFGDCRDPCLVTSMAAAANRAAKRAAAGLPPAALTAEVGVLVLAHEKGVCMAEAWEEWESLHEGKVVVLVHMKHGVVLTPAVPGHEWVARRQLSTRVASQWGDVSLTQAVLSAAAEMLKRCPNLQHIALVSGQDIPVAVLPLPLPAGVTMFGSFQFGHVYDAAAGRLAAAKLYQQLGLSATEACEWGDSLAFHHTWMMLSRPLLLALLSKQEEILRVGEVLNERFMQSDAAVAADEFMLITAALKYGYGRVIIRSKLQNYISAVRRQQKQQEAHLEFEEQDEQRRSKLLAAIPGSGNVSEDDEQYASAEELFLAIQAGAAAAILKQQETVEPGCASDCSGLSGQARPTRRRKAMTMQQGPGSNSSSSSTSIAALLPPKYPTAAAGSGEGVRHGGSVMGRQVTRSLSVVLRDNAAAEEATRELAAETGDLHHGVLLDCCPTLALFHPVKTRHPHTWRNFGQVFDCDLNAADEQEDGKLNLLQALTLVKPNQAIFFRKMDVQRSRGAGHQSAQEYLMAVLQLLWQGKQLPESVAVLVGVGSGDV